MPRQRYVSPHCAEHPARSCLSCSTLRPSRSAQLRLPGNHDRAARPRPWPSSGRGEPGLRALFAEGLADGGIELFSVRGARSLRTAADAQLLFQFTDAHVVAVVDDEDADRMNAIWTRAQEAHDAGSDYVAVLKEMTLEKTDPEARFLKDFCATALTGGRSN